MSSSNLFLFLRLYIVGIFLCSRSCFIQLCFSTCVWRMLWKISFLLDYVVTISLAGEVPTELLWRSRSLASTWDKSLLLKILETGEVGKVFALVEIRLRAPYVKLGMDSLFDFCRLELVADIFFLSSFLNSSVKVVSFGFVTFPYFLSVYFLSCSNRIFIFLILRADSIL